MRGIFPVVALLVAACGPEETGSPPPASKRPPPRSRPLSVKNRCVAEAGDIAARYQPVVRALCADRTNLGAPGAAIAIAEESRIQLSLGVGERCSGRGERVGATTPFRIGSVTKAFTAATALALEQAGRLSLSAPSRRSIPLLEALEPGLGALPLHRLLDHTAGLVDVMPTGATADLEGPALVSSWVEGARPRPDAPFRYANTGYYLAGRALEKVAGASYTELVRRHVLEPHGIDGSVEASKVVGIAACGHLRHGGELRSIDVVQDFGRHAHGAKWTLPAGGMIASAPDLVRFALGPGSGALARRARSFAVPTGETPGDRYALGVHVRDLGGGETLLFHRGSTGDFHAELYWIPARGFAVAVLANVGTPMAATIHAALKLAGIEEPPARLGSGDAPTRALPDGDAELAHRLVENEGALLLDVRSPQEHGSGHIEGSKNISHVELEARISEVERAVAGDKNTPVVVYCRSGRRAGIAKKILQAYGFTRVTNLGGMSDW